MCDRPTELLDEPWYVEMVICQHLVIGPAFRQFGHADARHSHCRTESELGDCSRKHLALAALDVVVVERDHGAALANRLLQPSCIDAIEEWQVDDANTHASSVLNFFGGMRSGLKPIRS